MIERTDINNFAMIGGSGLAVVSTSAEKTKEIAQIAATESINILQYHVLEFSSYYISLSSIITVTGWCIGLFGIYCHLTEKKKKKKDDK